MSTAEAPGRLLLDDRLDNGVAVVTVTGAVDVSTCGLLRDGLLRVITDEGHRGLVVSLARVTFIDSAGIGVLVGVWHRVHATNSRLALAAPGPAARQRSQAAGGYFNGTGCTDRIRAHRAAQVFCLPAAPIRSDVRRHRFPVTLCSQRRLPHDNPYLPFWAVSMRLPDE